MRVNHTVYNSPISDFLIDGKTFEIGGKKKGQKQITDAEEGYIVKMILKPVSAISFLSGHSE